MDEIFSEIIEQLNFKFYPYVITLGDVVIDSHSYIPGRQLIFDGRKLKSAIGIELLQQLAIVLTIEQIVDEVSHTVSEKIYEELSEFEIKTILTKNQSTWLRLVINQMSKELDIDN